MLAFPEPPKADSGTQYASLEARCQACVINDGDEAPCLNEIALMVEKEATGFPCPYRAPATTHDGILLRLATMAREPNLGHLFRASFDVEFETNPPRYRRQRMRMILAALSDKRIQRRMKALDAAETKATEKAPAN